MASAAPAVITPELIEAVIQAESGQNPQAVSPKGAKGLMQLMAPAWADVQRRVPELAGFGYDDYWSDETTNRRFGTEYLKIAQGYLPEPLRQSVPHILAVYNFGPGNLKKAGYDLNRVPRETRDYIGRITGALETGRSTR